MLLFFYESQAILDVGDDAAIVVVVVVSVTISGSKDNRLKFHMIII